MIPVTMWLKRGLSLAGDLLLIPVGLLLLVLVAILSRPLFVIAVPAAAGGLVWYVASPAFRSWLDAKVDGPAHFMPNKPASGSDVRPIGS